jgi:N6-L-threonylcarbamoyladenine synthase
MDRELVARRALIAVNPSPSLEEWLAVTPRTTLDVLASFQQTVIDELLSRTARSASEMDARTVIVSGGVACNSGLRRAVAQAKWPYPVYFPSVGLSTDNAAMIAAAAFPKLVRGDFAGFDLRAKASLALA